MFLISLIDNFFETEKIIFSKNNLRTFSKKSFNDELLLNEVYMSFCNNLLITNLSLTYQVLKNGKQSFFRWYQNYIVLQLTHL